jgi:DNA-binding NarL/FixJ family response regulator
MAARSVTPTLPTRVLCVDDNPDITAVMKLVIQTDEALECVGCLGSADQLMEKVRNMDPPPHVVLLDATMPGKSPLVVMKEMSAGSPDVKTIIYSGHEDEAFLDRIRDAGAWGFVSKNDEADAILKAVHEVAAGNVWWPPTKR